VLIELVNSGSGGQGKRDLAVAAGKITTVNYAVSMMRGPQ
jgi:hypothetical protein